MGSLMWALAGQLLPIRVESPEWLSHEAHPASGQGGGGPEGGSKWFTGRLPLQSWMNTKESSGLSSSLSYNSAALTSEAQAPPPTPSCNRPEVTRHLSSGSSRGKGRQRSAPL